MAGSSRRQSRRKQKSPRKQAARPAPRDPQVTLDELLADIRRDPQDIPSRLALGTFYLAHNLHDRIPDALEPIAGLYPFSDARRRLQYDRLLAFGFATTRQLTKAEDAARRGLQASPESVDFRFILAFVAMSMSEYQSAIEHAEAYLEAIEKYESGQRVEGEFAITPPHRSQLLNILGSAYMDAGRLEEARDPYERAIAQDSGNYLPYLNLARVWSRLGNRQKARDVVERGLKKSRQIQELRMLLADLQDKPTVSACMIVKDEEELLPGCLESIRDWVDEIIIVDTGSTDRTVEIAESFGARVLHQPWEGDFSKHRNFSIEQATCDWVLIIDADEEMVVEDVPKLKPLLADERYDIVCLNVFNVYTHKPDQVTFLPSMRLFRRRLNLRYEGIVHNQLRIPSDARTARIGVRIKHYGYGLSQEKMRRKVQRSMALLEKQLAENPNDPFALFNLAQLLRGKDDFSQEDAERILECAGKVIELTDPTLRGRRHLHLMALDQLSWGNYKLKRYDEALVHSERALEIRPDYLDALLLKGHILSTVNRVDEARETYQAYLKAQAAYEPSKEHDPLILQHVDSRTTAYYGLALLAHEQGRTQDEKAALLETMRLTPGYMKSALRLAEIYLTEGNLKEAERLFRTQKETGRDVAQASLGLAHVAIQQQDSSVAEELLRHVLELEPTNTAAITRLVEIYRETGRFEQAAEILNRAGAHEDRESLDHGAIAQAFFEMGRYRDAADQYRVLIERQEAGAETYNDLANCYFKLEEFDQAELFYRESLRLSPNDFSANRNLGLTLARQNRHEEAIELLETALQRDGKAIEIVHIVGDLYRRLGQHAKALPYYERFLTVNPADTLALFHLSECYLAMGHTDSAKMGYQRILQIDSGFRPAQERLVALAGAVSEGVVTS